MRVEQTHFSAPFLQVSPEAVQHTDRTHAGRVIFHPITGRNNHGTRKTINVANARERPVGVPGDPPQTFPGCPRSHSDG